MLNLTLATNTLIQGKLMITLTTTSYLHEADLLCMKLEAAGIKTFIPDQSTASIQPLYSGAIGGIRIQIVEQDLAKAREILAAKLEPTDKGIFQCPECGANAINYQRVSTRFAFLSLLLLGIPLLWFKRTCTCKSCHHKWKEK